MSKLVLRSLTALALSAVMPTGSAWAQGRGHGRGANQGWRMDRDHDMWGTRDWRGDLDQGTFDNNQRPRGWNQGRKTGWGNCDLPPGQAKKMGCNSGFGILNRPTRGFRRDRDHDQDLDRFRRTRSRDRDGDHNRDRNRRGRR